MTIIIKRPRPISKLNANDIVIHKENSKSNNPSDFLLGNGFIVSIVSCNVSNRRTRRREPDPELMSMYLGAKLSATVCRSLSCHNHGIRISSCSMQAERKLWYMKSVQVALPSYAHTHAA